jgi:ribonuclease D
VTPILVASNADLQRAAARWRGVSDVALDTEFIRTRTFYPIAALYQIAVEDAVWLVDPVAIDDFDPLVALLRDADVRKVMHACGEDLEVFSRHLGCAPEGIFDTQVAEGFLSPNFSPSLSELVRRHTGVELAKHETRSDWLARPLSPEQLRYAVEDVSSLLTIERDQLAALDRLGRRDWFETECRQRCRLERVDAEDYYRTVRGANRCDARELRRLRRLCAWRERRARERDLPRGRVVKDDELLAIAVLAKPDRDAISHAVHPGAARRYWRDLLALVEAADSEPESTLPPLLPNPPTRGETRRVKALRDCAQEIAERHALAPELLARRRDLEVCVRTFAQTGELSAPFQGWRYGLVGDAFAAILRRGEESGE